MRLDGDRWAAGERDALDHIRIERALRQELGAAELFRFRFKDIDEELANRLALLFRIADTGQRGQELLRCINVDERNIVVPLNSATTFSASASRSNPWSRWTMRPCLT